MKNTIYISLVVLVFAILSCKKDFIVEDIDAKTLTVNSPANNTATTTNLVTFWWDELDGAEKYTLQIVRPTFANSSQLLLDTSIYSNKFSFTLKPGSYQWRIKATNAGHSTVFQVFNLKIDTTSDLSELFVERLSPVQNAVIGNTVVTFNWSAINVATKYRLQINNSTGTYLDTTLVSKTSLTYNLQAAKNATTAYTWNVKALNETSQTQFNVTSFTLTIDKKGPSTPVLSSPSSGTLITQSDSLKWTRGSDAIYDSVYVADDSLFQNNLQMFRSDINRIVVSEFGLPASPTGTYYWWKIRSFDLYGNASAYSSYRKFRLAP